MTSDHRRERRSAPQPRREAPDEATRRESRPERPPDLPTTGPRNLADRPADAARLATVLDLQRSAGNAAIAGELRQRGDRPPPEHAPAVSVQRAPPRVITEFVPVVPPPGATPPLRVFGRYTHTWTIANARSAPPGTQFHWGYGVAPNGTGELLGGTATRNGATTRLQIRVRKPGQLLIQGTPVHQVPGGPQVVGTTRRAELPVAAPTLTLLSIMPRKADGSGADLSHLSAGDKLIVRVRVGNVDGRHIEDPAASVLTGTGLGCVSATSGATPVQSFADGRSYDIELTAVAPGSLNLQLELGIGDAALGQGPRIKGISGEVELDRQEFINRCSQCLTKIDDAYTQADSIMEVLSAAYGNAYDQHDRVLNAQDASNRLAGEILLNAALAFIPGGVGGVVGGWMKDAKFGNFLVDAVKDLAKAGTRGLQGTVAPEFGRGGVMNPMADDPRTWRAQAAVRVNAEKRHVLGILHNWQNKANGNDPTFYRNFNPVEKMDESLVRDGKPLTGLPVPDQAEHQRTFELGMWRGWLENFAYTVEERRGQYGETQRYVAENQGKKIRDRINALGEDGDAWLERYGGEALRKAQNQLRGPAI